MTVDVFDLEKGDVLIMHSAKADATKDLIHSHAALVAMENEFDAGIPLVFDIIGGYGFQRLPLPRSRQLPWSVYRLSVRDIGRMAAQTGSFWLGNSEAFRAEPRRQAVSSPNVYSRSSLITSFLGDPGFGPKAEEYVKRLHESHRFNPPDELKQSTAGLFSGVICSFLPIALYQTVLGVAGSDEFMAIDPKRSVPRDLAKYLHNNKSWEFLGLCEKR